MVDVQNRIIESIENDETIQSSKKDIAEVESANRSMISNIRQGVQLGIFAAQAIGFMIDQTLTLMVEALLLGIEVTLAIRAGGIASIGPQQIIQIGTVIAMVILVVKIKQEKEHATRQFQGIVGGLRMAGFRG